MTKKTKVTSEQDNGLDGNLAQKSVFYRFEYSRKMYVPIAEELGIRLGAVMGWLNIISNAETGEYRLSILERGKREGMMEKYNKKWIALRLALELYNIMTKDSPRFFSQKQQYLARIKILYPEFYNKILPIVAAPSMPLGFLAQIKPIINNHVFVISYIKTHYEELMEQIGRIEDGKTADRIRKAVIFLSGREEEELIRCVNDVRSWPYKSAGGVQLFIERGFLYINGGKSRYDNISFPGFSMHFRDYNLIAQMKSSPEIRKLLTYVQEIQFFAMAKSAIKKSLETQGNWEGFYDFYNNLKRGKNYIKMVREKFGNEQFAVLLEAFEEKKHEAPVDWEHELEMLDQQLIVRAYDIVVQPAAHALLGIFDGRIKFLNRQKADAIVDLAKMLGDDSSSKSAFGLLKLLVKTRKMLKKDMETEKRMFEGIAREVILALPGFASMVEQIDGLVSSGNGLKVRHSAAKRLGQWQRFSLSNLRTALLNRDESLNDVTITSLTRAAYANYTSKKIADGNLRLQEAVELKYTEASRLLQALIRESNEVLIPNTGKCKEHIDSRLIDYTPDVMSVLNSKQQGNYNLKLKAQSGKDYPKESAELAA